MAGPVQCCGHGAFFMHCCWLQHEPYDLEAKASAGLTCILQLGFCIREQ